MKIRYLMTAALALSLVTGCVEIKIDRDGCDGKAKHSDKEDKEDRKEHKHKDKDGDEDEENESRESQDKLKAEAKVSEADATQTALAKVTNGTIKESELEREDGHLQWSFDIATPDTKDITEVNVDAITGNVINIEKEKPESDEAGEHEKHDKD